jgi:hypothetical protein
VPVVIIIVEILRTVTAHFSSGGFQSGGFLIIGIISAGRHNLTASASLTLERDGTNRSFQHAMIELGDDEGEHEALVVGLVLVRAHHATDG